MALRFQDKARYRSKIAIFHTSFYVPPGWRGKRLRIFLRCLFHSQATFLDCHATWCKYILEKVLFAIRYDTIVCILTCSKKLTGSQLNPPDGDHFARYRQTDRQTDGRKSDLNSAALTMQRSLKTKYYKQVWRVYGATSKPPPLPQAYGVWFFTVFVVGYRARFVVGPRSKVSCGARRDVCCRSRSPLGSNNRFSDKPIRLPIGCQ